MSNQEPKTKAEWIARMHQLIADRDAKNEELVSASAASAGHYLLTGEYSPEKISAKVTIQSIIESAEAAILAAQKKIAEIEHEEEQEQRRAFMRDANACYEAFVADSDVLQEAANALAAAYNAWLKSGQQLTGALHGARQYLTPAQLESSRAVRQMLMHRFGPAETGKDLRLALFGMLDGQMANGEMGWNVPADFTPGDRTSLHRVEWSEYLPWVSARLGVQLIGEIQSYVDVDDE